MAQREKKTVLEKNIETIVKKLNIFTINDLEILLEKSKVEIIPIIEKMIKKHLIKEDGCSYIYIPKIVKTNNIAKREVNPESLIHALPIMPKKPKEIYLRNINEIDGFVDYFFAPPPVKEDIKTMLKVLKETHNVSNKKLNVILEKYNITPTKYGRFKNEILKNGLTNLVGSETREPGEIYQFFKEYYLSPKGYTTDEARELAIQRFERLIRIKINRGNITKARTMLNWVKKEYSEKQIKKFRNYNFSEFDTEHIFKE